MRSSRLPAVKTLDRFDFSFRLSIVNIRGNSYRMRAHQDLLRPAHDERRQETASRSAPNPRPRHASGVGRRERSDRRPTPEPWAATPDACSGPCRPRRSVQFSVATSGTFSAAIDNVPTWQRSIPAGAGEPVRSAPTDSSTWVYPRRCGGTSGRPAEAGRVWGLSPQVRGNREKRGAHDSRHGSIPAGAGEPDRSPRSSAATGVYPRRCGGTAPVPAPTASTTGLSPQVRGNRVVPRRCGGTGSSPFMTWLPMGLSPQVRGNPGSRRRRRGHPGSIPAGAGEPAPWARPRARSRVYPRRCGGTLLFIARSPGLLGLSPQVRGNPRPGRDLLVDLGSIPAGAGEPGSSSSARGPRWVYPRRCGGTVRIPIDTSIASGLSPQVRGNPRGGRPLQPVAGSIPAGAGEPRDRALLAHQTWVYPRRCGGTTSSSPSPSRSTGLSPQVRGNRGRSSSACC